MSENFPIGFQGVQEGADPKQLPPGTLRVVENCRMDKTRRLRKRGGVKSKTRNILGGGALATGKRLFSTRDGGLGVVDGSSAYVFVDRPDVNHTFSWKRIGRVYPFTVTQRPLNDSVQGSVCVDAAVYGDWLVTTWMAGDQEYASAGTPANRSIFVQVQNRHTWAMVLPPTIVAVGLAPKVVIRGDKAIVFYGTAAGQLLAGELDLLTLVVTAGVWATAGNYTVSTCPIDVGPKTGAAGDGFHVLARLTAGANRVSLIHLTSAYVNDATLLTGGAFTGNALCVDTGTDPDGTIYVAFGQTGQCAAVRITFIAGVYAIVLGPTNFAAVTSPAQVWTIYDSDTGNVLVGYSTTREFYSRIVTKAALAAVANTDRRTRDMGNASRPFRLGGRWYATALVNVIDSLFHFSGLSRVVVELRSDANSGSISPWPHAQAGTLENMAGWKWEAKNDFYLPTSPVAADGIAYVISMFPHEEPAAQADAVGTGAHVNVLTPYGADAFRVLHAGNASLMVGPAPMRFDDSAIIPQGFTHAPMIQSAAAGAGGSGSMAAGTYQYAAIFVRIGADGLEERSMVSDVCTVPNVVATGSVQLTFAPACLSGRLLEEMSINSASQAAHQTMIEIWRTEVNGSDLFRLTREPLYNVITNDPTLGSTATYTDTRADADITTGGVAGAIALNTQPRLYTELETDDGPPPAFTTGTVHRNRFVGIDPSEMTVWPSKDASEALNVVPGFDLSFVVQFARPKKALLSLDEKLIAWGENDVDIVFGPGPDASGSGQGWEIQRVQSDVGCTNPRSLVATPMGAVFESRRGLELLSRDLGVSRLGKAIEDTLAAYPTITSAVLVEDESEVRFTCTAADGLTGIVLAWDYLHSIWFTRKYHNAAGTDAIPFADAIAIDGVYYLLGTDGVVYEETFDFYWDEIQDESGTASARYWVTRDVQLAPFEPSGSGLGWHRVKDCLILGTSKSDHILELSAAHDFASAWSQVETYAENTEPTVVGATNKARITFAEQKVQALALRIRDLEPAAPFATTGEGPIFESLLFRAMTKRGPARATDAESK